MVDLTQTELATEEDKAYQIDYWARLFKAKTWEELKMLTQENEYLEDAAVSLYRANAEEIVRQQCRAREDVERRERTLKRDLERAKKENKALKEDNIRLQEESNAKDAYIAELEAKLGSK